MTDDLDTYLTNFAARILQDAMNEATSAYWLRRAAQFEAARPRPGEFYGKATLREIRERDLRCRDAAEACRAQARMVRAGVAA